jgi:hypothetical protein
MITVLSKIDFEERLSLADPAKRPFRNSKRGMRILGKAWPDSAFPPRDSRIGPATGGIAAPAANRHAEHGCTEA